MSDFIDWDETTRVINEMNKEHAVVKIQGKTVIMNKEHDKLFDRDEITLSSEPAFNLWYKNTSIIIGQTAHVEPKPKYSTHSEMWIKSSKRRQFKGFCFDPNGKNDPDYFNLWRGFACKPVKGDCSRYYRHLKQNVASGDDVIYTYILDWMADCVQNPANLPGVAFVLRGGSGAGKGTTISLFADIFGQHTLHVSHAKHVVGHFNAHLKDCVILFADEAFYAGDKEHESVLKTLISESTRIIEYKGKDAMTFPNYTHLMMSSNKDWVVPVEMDDRRFFIVDIDSAEAKKESYFDPIYQQMRGTNRKTPGKGTSALLYDLLKRDISKRSIRDIPTTQAKFDHIIESLDNVNKWVYNLLIDDSDISMMDITVKNLYEHYIKSCEKSRPVSKNMWSRKLKRFFPDLEVKQRIGGDRFYEFPLLNECRRLFSKTIGYNVDWNEA